MKNFKRKLSGLSLLAILKAKAGLMEIIMGFMVLAIGTVVCYQLFEFCKKYLPVTPGADNTPIAPQAVSVFYVVPPTVYYVGLPPQENVSKGITITNVTNFTFAYGLVSNTVTSDTTNPTPFIPWIYGDTNVIVPPVTVILNDTSNDYEFVTCVGSEWFYGSLTIYPDTNDDQPETVLTSECDVNSLGSVTNVYDESVDNDTNVEVLRFYQCDAIPSIVPAYPVIIERSTDLVNWYPIATNTCQIGFPQLWTDTAAPLPIGYYRAVFPNPKE